MNTEFHQLREALLDLVGFLNRAQPDEALLREAGVQLDRALFPLLAHIGRRGPIGVVELADVSGRDYTTISRQVAKLERMGLVTRQTNPDDNRIREALITPHGRELINALDAARERLMTVMLAEWDARDLRELVRLLRRLADDALAWMSDADNEHRT